MAFAIGRAANCPLDEDPVDSSVPDGDDCTGPPVFAGTPADPADPEASVTTSSEVLAASATPGVPESVPAGPPDSIPAGQPGSVPVGPPAGVPAGPPDSLPANG